MKLPQGKKIRWDYVKLAFAIPFVGMLFVMLISKYEPFGKYSMLYSDMYHQYYPFFVEFRNAIRSGDGLLYTWSVGLGMDYLGLISYYLASPLNLLSVIVPEMWLLEYFSLLVPVKLGLAGAFFAYFLKKLFGKDDLSISVFGGFYGLCAWALGFQWNIMWLDSFALLPLVALGTVYLLRDKKFVLYTLSLFLSIFANYYIGLFTCIFVFLLFFVYQICRWGSWKKFFLDLCRIALFSALAIGMTAILELPALAALQTTQSSVNKFPTSFRLNITSDHTIRGLLDAMRQVAGNMGGSIKPNFKEGLPNVYCGIISVYLMFLYLASGEIRLRDKICAVGLLLFFNVSFIIRQLDYIWHGFHFTNMIPYRFSFLYSFVVLYMAYNAWLLRRKFSTRKLLGAGLLAAAVLACSEELTATVPLELGPWEADIPLYFIYNLTFLVLYMLAMMVGNIRETLPEDATEKQLAAARAEQARNRRRASWLVLTVMGVELIANLICFGLYFTGTGVSNYPKGTEKTASVIRYMKEREKGNLFYRAETTHSQTLNDGALNNYNGVSAFTSSANVKTTLFMQSLGYGAKNTYNRYLFEESSPVANLFLGLKYMLERDGKDKTSTFFKDVNTFGNTTLLENQAYLPLGFLAENTLADVVFDTAKAPFTFQNELFTGATGISGNVWRVLPGEYLNLSATDLTILESSGGYCKYSETKQNSSVTYSYTAPWDGFMCIHLNLPKRNDYYVSINGTELYKETISLPQMIAVDDVAAGDQIDIRIVCDAGENSTMTVNAAILDHAVFRQGYEILNTSTLELTEFESTRLEGTIACDREGLLYTSIPQNGNWHVSVDGREAETILVGDCMTAVRLNEGTHLVSFEYRNGAFSLGWKITLGCAAVFGILIWVIYKPEFPPKTQKTKKKKHSRKGKYQR
ncbi:MAG: YfhO family protein [Oscillospiraceae bacterium]|nr:YfhO family protein [Oscillospiraceae bacterium]